MQKNDKISERLSLLDWKGRGRMIGAAIIFLVLLCAFLLWNRRRIPLYKDNDRTRASILKAVPVGTPTDTAKGLMERAGFVCELMENASLIRRNSITQTSSRIDNQTFLHCDRERTTVLLVCNKRWQVSLLVPNGTVDDVEVSFGTSCL